MSCHLIVFSIFMDEIDAIGERRFSEGTSDDREIQRTLMELLIHLDGFDDLGKEGFIVPIKIENLVIGGDDKEGKEVASGKKGKAVVEIGNASKRVKKYDHHHESADPTYFCKIIFGPKLEYLQMPLPSASTSSPSQRSPS